MVRPILKMLMSPDLFEIEAGAEPPNPESFVILVQCLIGEEGPAADTFDVVVLTPDKVPGQIGPDGILSGRGYLVMRRYDYPLLRSTIAGWCEKSAAPEWETSAAYLCRYLHWEFETT